MKSELQSFTEGEGVGEGVLKEVNAVVIDKD